MGYTVLAEWLDENQHRVFPLEDSMSGFDSTSTFQLPTSFMVDVLLCVPPGTDITKYYVKTVLVRRHSVDVTIGYDGDGRELTVGTFARIPATQDVNSVYSFAAAAQPLAADKPFTIMTGSLVVGSVTELLDHPGLWSFQCADASLLSSRVTEGLAGVTALMVGDDARTGAVALKEGPGVTLTPSYDAVNNRTIITVSADLGNLEELSIPLVDDASVLANLTALYGTPVTSVNGVTPDASGNFTLRPLDCTEFKTIPGGLSVDNPCSLPCCDKSVLDDAYTSISELNLRYARMEGYYQSVGRNVNDLQSRMIALEI